MKRAYLFALALIIGFACTTAKKIEEKSLSALTVKGKDIINSEGQVTRLEGVSFSDPDKLEKDGHWNLAYFKEASDWGCNVVRFAIHPRAWRERGEETYLALLDQGVQWATETGMYVIMDWHSIGNLKDDKYFQEMYNTSWDETVAFWKAIANRYKGNTTAALYELFNEPTDYNGTLGELSWSTWKPLVEKLIDEINAIDDQKIILVAGMNWGYLLDEVLDNPVDRPNVAYVTHPYPQKRDQPWEPQWENDWGKVADRYPIVATEFGFVGKGERGEHIPCIGDETYGEAIIGFFDQKGISYTVWVFDPHWSPALLEDYNFVPTRQGRFFKSVLQRAK
jgi:endoglucanase